MELSGREVSVVELQNIHKRYSSHSVLNGVSLTIRRGETMAIIGANGSGKSTLFRIIAGLTASNQGTRRIIPPNAKQDLIIGYAPDRLPKLRFTPREYLRHGKLTVLSIWSMSPNDS
jgi:ABC-type multidrug transport system ATPase subunit